MDMPAKEKERDIPSTKVEPVSSPTTGATILNEPPAEKYGEPPSRSSDVVLVSVSDEIEERYRDLVDKTIRSRALLDRSIGSASPISSVREFSIRALDIVGSLAILLLCMPAMAVAAVLTKVLSPGPVLYKQRRVGKDGRTFTLYKFRTMTNRAEAHTGPLWAAKDESRVTPIGRVLRRTRLDELPQLFSVLRGDMSLVGPRPEKPYFVRRHKFFQGPRLAVKPGLTGLAQIRSFYNLKPDHKVKYDYLYIQKRSLWLNLYVLLKTAPVIFFKKGW